jgi:membrane protein DedA with SNARE-associated domain
MYELIAKYGFVLILFAVLLEEVGIPMPIPTDVLIVLAGVESHGIPERVGMWFVVLNIASALGATGLYTISRRGGRPLIDRFGKYVHLGPSQLARGEGMLKRGGWWGIAVGRAIPGLRYVTVIACGLLRVPYLRFITAHIVGSSVYIGVFLWLGAQFGSAIIDSIHAPEQVLRAFWLILLSLGLPSLFAWLYYRSHTQRPTDPSRFRLLGALLLASFFGAISLEATWALGATIADLVGISGAPDIGHTMATWLQQRGLHTMGASFITYAVVFMLCIAVGVSYYEWILPRLAPHGDTLIHEISGLAIAASIFLTAFLVPLAAMRPHSALRRLWETNGSLLVLSIAISIACFACTTVYCRALSILVLPSRRRPPIEPAGYDPQPDALMPSRIVPEADQ